jgi:hypothetical protein
MKATGTLLFSGFCKEKTLEFLSLVFSFIGPAADWTVALANNAVYELKFLFALRTFTREKRMGHDLANLL